MTANTKKPAYCYTFAGIPNTAKGRAFVAQVREYLNRGRFDSIRIRGNGPRSAAAVKDGFSPRSYDQDLPIEHAKTLRVYLDRRQDAAAAERARAEYWERDALRRDLNDHIKMLADSDEGLRRALAAEREVIAERDAALKQVHEERAIADKVMADAEAQALKAARYREQMCNAQKDLNAVPMWILSAVAMWREAGAILRGQT